MRFTATWKQDHVLVRICCAIDCELNEIVEIERDKLNRT